MRKCWQISSISPLGLKSVALFVTVLLLRYTIMYNHTQVLSVNIQLMPLFNSLIDSMDKNQKPANMLGKVHISGPISESFMYMYLHVSLFALQYLDEIEVSMETCSEIRDPGSTSTLADFRWAATEWGYSTPTTVIYWSTCSCSSAGKYGLAEKIVDGMFVSINSVVVNLKAPKFSASIQVFEWCLLDSFLASSSSFVTDLTNHYSKQNTNMGKRVRPSHDARQGRTTGRNLDFQRGRVADVAHWDERAGESWCQRRGANSDNAASTHRQPIESAHHNEEAARWFVQNKKYFHSRASLAKHCLTFTARTTYSSPVHLVLLQCFVFTAHNEANRISS